MGQVQGSSMDRRFFHKLGATLLERTICSSAGKAGIKYTLGASVGMDPERFEDAKLILIWGSNPITSNLHFWSRVTEAKRRGAKVIAIDPYQSLSAEKCHQHIAPLPGTDAALALGMMHVIINEKRYDQDYVAKYTLGFEQLKQRVQDYPPARVARICGLSEDVIVALAREYSSLNPSAIRLNYGMQRHTGGGIAVRTVTCLPALTGAWRHAAGGILLATSDFYSLDTAALERPDLLPQQPRSINMVAIGDALLQAQPPVKAVVVYNSNPVAVAPDSSKVAAGFAREDLFCVVLEQFQTDTVDYADIVLPVTTQLEHYDIHKSYGHLYMLANNPAIEPMGECKPNSEIFRLLAARMGFEDACFKDSDEDIARQAIGSGRTRMGGIQWNALKRDGWQRLDVPAQWAPFAQGNFPTPSGKCEFYSAALKEIGFDPLPFYNPPIELPDSNPTLAKIYPLVFLSPPARNFLNTTFANMPRFREQEGEPTLELHSADAQARGISDGDYVSMYNDRGSMRLKALVNDKPRPGVVVARSIWWRKFAPDGKNANEVTPQRVSDLGGGATFYDCLVEVAKT
jgi:anaerobic selenocysteine-containing dehydrogenase